MTRLVLIKWYDSASASGWHSKEQLNEQLESESTLCQSVGLLVERKNKDKVTIVQTCGVNEVIGIFEIPVGCIRSVETLCSLPITIET
jgi:hypothetical protein